MKRLNWLKNFGLLASVAGAAVPIVLTSASCGVTTIKVDKFDFKKVIEDKSASRMESYSTSFDNLLYGSMSNHNGNYVLFVGSNTGDSTVRWFATMDDFRARDHWWGEQYFPYTPFYRALVKTTTDDKIRSEGIKDCGIYCAIDFFDFKVYDKKGHEIYISKDGTNRTDKIKPFDKWSDSIIAQTKLYNKNLEGWKYEWDDTSVSKSDYIRQDESAVAYRTLVKRGKELYPKTDKRKETFDDSDNIEDGAKMCVFKDGKLVSIDNIPNGRVDAGIDTFVKILVDNYKVAKDEEKPK